ncbi:MAG TPA: DUF480 domain-containing protein [Chthoniobacterales bacterium]
MELTPVETRVLGCLLEKERTTPEVYPLTMNSLVAACNQTTNREPMVAYDDQTVEAALDSLRQKQLAIIVHTAGARVPKYRHRLLDQYELNPKEVALLCLLLLRGPQTPGELRARGERLAGPVSLPEVEATLAELARGDAPLTRSLAPRPGQKERRYVQLLSGPHEETDDQAASPPEALAAAGRSPGLTDRLAAVEAEAAALRRALSDLQAEFDSFRRQFE